MERKEYRITVTFHFEIDATSEEAAREIAIVQGPDWLGNENIDMEKATIEIKEIIRK